MLQNYTDVTNQAKNVAATPYNPYGGQLVAGINDQQNTGIGGVNTAATVQNPYNQGATGLAAASSGAIDPTQYSGAQLQPYENPYQSQVVNATETEIANQNAQQQAALQGNAVSAGAFGGDRAGVAQAALAGQQDIANNATLANLNTANFTNAQGEFNTQQGVNLGAQQNTAARQLAASQQIGNLGAAAQSEGLAGANAQVNAGTLEQATQQSQDTAAYNQFLQQQAYPFQTTGWLANIVEGIGSQSGGTTTGEQTQQSGNGLSTVAGGLLGLGSFFLPKADGGRVEKAVGGGLVPYGEIDPTTTPIGGGSYVTPANLAVGHTMPQGMSVPQQAQQNPLMSAAQGMKAAQGLGNAFSNSSLGDAANDFFQDNFARGGLVRSRFDAGGNVEYDPSQGLGNGDLTPEALARYGASGASTPSLSPAFVAAPTGAPNPYGGLTDPPAPTLASQYAQGQMPAPQDPSATADAKLRVAMGAPQPSDLAANYALGQMPAPSQGVSGAVAPSGLAAAAPSPSADVASPGGLGTATAAGAPTQLPGSVLAAKVPSWSDVQADNAAGTANIANRTATNYDPVRADAAVKSIESGGDYSAVGPATSNGDHAYGAHQVMGANIPAWTAKWVGQAMTPAQFLADPKAQDAVFQGQFGSYVKQYGNVGDAASAWFTGKPLTPQTAGLKDSLGTSDNAYVNKFINAYAGTSNGAPAAQAINAAAATAPQGLGQARGQQGGLAAASYSGAPLTADSPVASTDARPAAPDQGGGLFGFHLSDAARQGLLAAGLGMMGGTSMNPWTNIGQGGLAGVGAYNNARKLQSEIGLQGAQAGEFGAQAGLTGQQTVGAEYDNQIKAARTKRLLDRLNQHAQEGSAKADAVAAQTSGVTTPTVTAPNVANAPVGTQPNSPWNLDALVREQNQAVDDASIEMSGAKEHLAAVNEKLQILREGGLDPQFANAKAAQAGKVTGAEEAAKTPYEMVDVQPTPGGPTYKVPKSSLLSGPGAGSPPGSPLDAAATANPNVAKQPAFIEDKQKMIATNENTMLEQAQARQVARQRLQTMAGILQTFQPGAFAEQKADLLAKLSAVGIQVPPSATANAAAFQEFTKNATAGVFDQVKGMGGRVLVSEIEGLTKANANAGLQPQAAAHIIGQALGTMDYEDKHTQDYFDWKKQNPNAYDTSGFELPWLKSHPVSGFVNSANKGIAYSGQQIPPAAQRATGQTYMTPKGPMTWVGNGWRPAAASP